ncbi:MAG: sigma-70 family RNA polymerase sigma factor [Acidobacteria bacterium]|nr:sigma-70 family RNA polymerase sigma factor [Acidobacteriota bacterium]
MDLETTIEELAVPLLRYCLGKTGSRELAEDLAQEALTALVQRWRRHGAPKDAAGFVFTVARRRAGRWLRRRALLRPMEQLVERASLAPGPAEECRHRNEVALARSALQGLSARDREILLLVAAGDLQVQQAATVCRISLSAAKMRLHRARRRLAEQMEKNHEIRRSRPEPAAG